MGKINIRIEGTNWLDKIARLSKEYGKGTVLFSVVVFLLYTNLIKSDIGTITNYRDFLRYENKAHDDGLIKRSNADMIIPPLLDNIRIELNASRVILFEFHNGGDNIANLPFKHFSATYESINDRDTMMHRIADEYYYQRTGDYYGLLTELSKYGYFYASNISLIKSSHPELYYKFLRDQDTSVYITEINGIRTPIGMIYIASKKAPLDLARINDVVQPVLQKLSLLLEGISAPKV
jgi:hypothetical protein